MQIEGMSAAKRKEHRSRLKCDDGGGDINQKKLNIIAKSVSACYLMSRGRSLKLP